MTRRIKRDRLGRFARVHSSGSSQSRREIQQALLEDVAREQARIELTGNLTPGMRGKVKDSLRRNLGTEAAESQAQREVMANLTAEQMERLKVVLDIQDKKYRSNNETQGKGKIPQTELPSQTSRSDEVVTRGRIPDHLLPPALRSPSPNEPQPSSEPPSSTNRSSSDRSPSASSEPPTNRSTPNRSSPPSSSEPPSSSDRSPSDTSSSEPPTRKKKPTLRALLPDDALSVASSGQISLLNEKTRKHHKTFSTQQINDHNYQVSVDGKQVTLNKHTTQMNYKGEVVNGVPSTFSDLRQASNAQLVKAMAEYSQFISDKKAIAPAPKWNPKQHGELDKEFVGRDGYGAMQIHHVNQWSKTRFNEVTDKVLSGEISLEEGKKLARDLLKPDPSQRQGYSIDVLGKGNRSLVVLPGGSHDFTNNKMYLANHPKLVHPETGKMTKFGIPKSGEGGRKYFTSWYRGFWKEYYKHELTVMEREANTRISSGKMKPQDFQKAWDKQMKEQSDLHNKIKAERTT